MERSHLGTSSSATRRPVILSLAKDNHIFCICLLVLEIFIDFNELYPLFITELWMINFYFFISYVPHCHSQINETFDFLNFYRYAKLRCIYQKEKVSSKSYISLIFPISGMVREMSESNKKEGTFWTVTALILSAPNSGLKGINPAGVSKYHPFSGRCRGRIPISKQTVTILNNMLKSHCSPNPFWSLAQSHFHTCLKTLIKFSPRIFLISFSE